MRPLLLTAAVLPTVLLGGAWAEEDEKQDPSVSAFHMTGAVVEEVCKLTGYVLLGGERAPPVNPKAFTIERTSASGETERFVISPELKSDASQEAKARTFTWTDTSVRKGATYRYSGIYQADVYLSTCPVVLTVQETGVTPAPTADGLQVEVLGNNICMGNDVLLLRARATNPRAKINWSPLEPCMGQLLAQHNGTALLRAPAEPGSGHAYFKIEAKAGAQTAETYSCPNVVSMSWVPVEEYNAEELKEVASKSEKGKATLRARLERAYGKGGSTVERCMLDEYLLQVGDVADVVNEYLNGIEDRNAQYAVFSLIANHWPSYAQKHFFGAALENGDLPRLTVLLWRMGEAKGDGSVTALKGLRQCCQQANPVIRMSAVASLGAWHKKDEALPLLQEVLTKDPSPAVRFAAAGAISQQQTRKRPDTPPVPQYGSVTSTRADKLLARKLYLQVLGELGKPVDTSAFNDKNDFFAPLGDGLGGLIVEHRPEGLNAAVRPGSFLAQLCVLGDAVLPVMRKRFLNPTASGTERELLKWILDKNNIPFPSDIEDKVVEAFFTAKPEEREVALKFYIELGVKYPRLSEHDNFVKLDPATATPRDRLRCLADVIQQVQAVFEGNVADATRKLADVRLDQKASIGSQEAEKRCLWLWRWLQQQDDAAGEYVRAWLLKETQKGDGAPANR